MGKNNNNNNNNNNSKIPGLIPPKIFGILSEVDRR